MYYDLNRLTCLDFELLCQSLSKQIFGNGSISFGVGPDGGREATFDGIANYPSKEEKWDGYWVIQAKFKNVRTSEESKDFEWLKSEIFKDIKKYKTRKIKVKIPDNLIYFTNIILTPVANSGGRDLANELIQNLKTSYSIKNISIISYDDLIDFLNNYRQVAVAFSGFILPGDILNKLLDLLNKTEEKKERINELIGRYLEIEFLNSINSKLEHAGKLTSDKINLEKVFVDLYATQDGIIPEKNTLKFIESTINIADQVLCPSLQRVCRFVLIAGPGYGKSTLTQFLAQIYRAFFLQNIDQNKSILHEVNEFILEYNNSDQILPKAIRLPFRITLKEYANWIIQQNKKQENYSVLNYIASSINKRTGEYYFTSAILEELICNISTVFIYDGLDEVPASSNRQEVIDEINNFNDIILRRADADSLIIGTSRPQGYTKEFNSSIYSHLKVTDLPQEDCFNYINKLLQNIENDADKKKNDLGIIKRALEDPIVNRLMKSPLQASIMTILVRSGGEPPRNKFELFTEYYLTIFKREKQKNVSKILNQHSTYINDIHYKLAFKLQVSSESVESPAATISIDQFENFIIEYLKTDVGLKMDSIQSITNEIVEASTKRLVFIEEVQDGFIGFSIRSIQEFFAANFYINIPDENIGTAIRQISASSYWNNTLMFCFGYLFKNKRYTIDQIESICYELNGSADAYNDASLKSKYFIGSWISLDTLNEAIFRGHPKYENKFSKFLQSLVTIPFFKNHLDFGKLPENIKEEWVLNFLQDELNGNPKSYTGWLLLLQIVKTGTKVDSSEYITKWNFSVQVDYKFLTIFIGNALYDSDLGIKVLQKTIQINSPNQIFKVIRLIRSKSILNIVQGNSDDKLWTAVLYTYMFRFYRNINPELKNSISKVLLKEAGVDGPLKGFREYFKPLDYKFSILSGVSGRIKSIILGDKKEFDILLKVAKHYNATYIIKVVEFYINPSIHSLYELIALFKEEDLRSNYIFEVTKELNWLFYTILSSEGSLEEKLIKIQSGEFGNLTDWLNTEELLHTNDNIYSNPEVILKLMSISSERIFSANEEENILFNWIKLTNNFKNNIVIKNDFVANLYWILDENYKIVKDEFKKLNNQELLLNAYVAYYNKREYDFTNENDDERLIILLSLLSDTFIINQYSTLESLFKRINFKNLNEYFFMRQEQPKVVAFKTIIRLYPILTTVQKDPSIIRLIPLILTEINLLVSSFINFDINIKANEIVDDDNAFSLACLYLISLHNGSIYLSALLELLNKIVLTDEQMNFILRLIENFTINKNLDEVLLLLNNQKHASYFTKSKCLEVTKSYCENQPSLLIPKSD
jgi:hypothetical protein